MSPINDARRTGRPWTTTTGLIVGGSYIRPAPMPTGDAERIQAALLSKPEPRESLGHLLVVPVCTATLLAVVLALWLGVLP